MVNIQRSVVMVVLGVFAIGLSVVRGQPQDAVPGGEPFEVAAWVDHFDFATFFDSETEAGIADILDHVAETGANVQFFRSSGSSIRHPSAFKPSFRTSLDKRKGVMGQRLLYDWVDYNRSSPDILALALRLGRERGMRPVVHWPFEECHAPGYYKAFMSWNMDHPQFWGRTAAGQPWLGRVSLCYPEVIDYKLAVLDELLERGAEGVFIDMFRAGMWGPWAEYVPPVTDSFREIYGEAPPAAASDLRWCQHVADYVTELFRQMRRHLDAYEARTGRHVDLAVGVPGIAPIGNGPLIQLAADWRAWVDEGIIDCLVMHSIDWDPERPFETYREYGREVMNYVDGRCDVHWPVSAYSFRGKGLLHLSKLANLSQAEVARRLTTIAWEEGAAGISMECVDYNNYQPATREALAELARTTCRTRRPWTTRGTAPPESEQKHRPRPAMAPRQAWLREPDPALEWLPAGPGNNTEAAWSPDGGAIIFQSDREDVSQLYRLDLGSSQVSKVDTGPGFSMFPAWSADGDAIFYVHGHFPETAFATIAAAQPGWNGSYLRQIDSSIRERLDGVNVWRLVLSEDGPPEQLTHGLVCDMLPEASPGGEAVYFSSPRGVSGPLPDSANTMLIQRRNPDGTVDTIYERNGAYAVQPTLSPDGQYVAFGRITSYAGIWHLMVARTLDKPGAAIRLTDRNLAAYAPRWSPDGGLIAFTGYRDGDPSWGVYLMPADGSGRAVRVSTGLARTRSPSWSPDGEWLLFEGERDGRYSLCRLPLSAIPDLPRSGPAAGEALDKLFASQPLFESDVDDTKGLANLFDGDTASTWRFSGVPHWIEARFPKAVTLGGVDFHHGMPSYFKYPSGSSSAKSYTLEAFVDGAWRALIQPVEDLPRYQGQGTHLLVGKHRFDPVTTQRVRLTVTATNDTGCRVSSPLEPCVAPEDRVTYLREISLLDAAGKPIVR